MFSSFTRNTAFKIILKSITYQILIFAI